jgi:Flp pilus assembly pilin Flp
MSSIRTLFQRINDDERAQGLAEYALVLAMVSLVCVGTVQTLGLSVKPSLVSVTTTLGSVVGP